MIIGVGVDVVDLTRFENTLADTPGFAERIFADVERDAKPQTLAGRWAAKEALVKVLGDSTGLNWHDVLVLREDTGKPTIALSGATKQRAAALGITNLHLSISHDAGIACAFVVAEGDN
jgi:holo-[acyl-carrier protein] synthase